MQTQYKFENMYTFVRYLVYVVMVLGVLVLWDMFINEIMVLIFLLSYNTNSVYVVCYSNFRISLGGTKQFQNGLIRYNNKMHVNSHFIGKMYFF